MGESKRSRRQFSSSEKAAILKRHLMGGEAVSAICEELDLAPNLFYRWQKELFDHADAAFEVKGRGRSRSDQVVSRKLERENEKLRAKLTRKDNIIAEVTEDYVKLKKTLGED